MPNLDHKGPEGLGPKTGMKLGGNVQRQIQKLLRILKRDLLEKE